MHFEDDGEDNVFIKFASRHPLAKSESFVPNVTDFCFSNDRIHLMTNITNSSGEVSTILSEVKIEHDDKLNIDKLKLLKLGDNECITYNSKTFGCFYISGSSFGTVSYSVADSGIAVDLKFFDAAEQELKTIS